MRRTPPAYACAVMCSEPISSSSKIHPAQKPAPSKTRATWPSPKCSALFTPGTLAKNIGLAELESKLEESHTGIERAFLIFNNIRGGNVANIRVGKTDPSAAFSFQHSANNWTSLMKACTPQ